jgi:hypothetical protein
LNEKQGDQFGRCFCPSAHSATSWQLFHINDKFRNDGFILGKFWRGFGDFVQHLVSLMGTFYCFIVDFQNAPRQNVASTYYFTYSNSTYLANTCGRPSGGVSNIKVLGHKSRHSHFFDILKVAPMGKQTLKHLADAIAKHKVSPQDR